MSATITHRVFLIEPLYLGAWCQILSSCVSVCGILELVRRNDAKFEGLKPQYRCPHKQKVGLHRCWCAGFPFIPNSFRGRENQHRIGRVGASSPGSRCRGPGTIIVPSHGKVTSEGARWLAKQIVARLPPGWGAVWMERGRSKL